ncbi:hypothetical protein B0H14DRAFT_2688879 [Mycena olivaceomarginata]|nr:hypothetical protein B0H14DRAFT_2897265 [Mycena olivaceomarginata]KAJ7891415.1 hypothetical protein B0H14DRAFT_2688879 [Mycena olivaceomarginata]
MSSDGEKEPVLLEPSFSTNIDWSLFILFASAVVSVLWGIALAIFAAGLVPIAWTISSAASAYNGLTNVVVTAVSSLSTAQLTYTIKLAVEAYTSSILFEGFTLDQWKFLRALSESSIWPPFKFPWRKQTKSAMVWLTLLGSLAAHSTSMAAILQPENFIVILHYDDWNPCGIPASNLSFNLPIPSEAQAQLEQAALTAGLELGTIYEQVSGNSTTSIVGRSFVKDNFGYGAIGRLTNALQEVPGVELDVQCGNETSSPDLESLWAAVRIPLPTVNLTNKTVSFTTDLQSNSSLQIVTSTAGGKPISPVTLTDAVPFAFFSAVLANGDGAMLTIDANGSAFGCIWNAIPSLVYVQIIDFNAAALRLETQTSGNTTLYPAAIGSALLGTLRGMATGITLGGSLILRANYSLVNTPHFTLDGQYQAPSANVTIGVLLGDGAKAGLTAYSNYFASHVFVSLVNDTIDEAAAKTGVSICSSNNRSLHKHWRFGNLHWLGTLAIIQNCAIGAAALWVVFLLARPGKNRRIRMKGVEPLEVSDAFRLGVGASPIIRETNVRTEQLLRVRSSGVEVKLSKRQV